MQAGDFVTLALGKEVFGVPVAYVREILDYRAPFRIPEGPDYLLGLLDVRGRGTPMLDLRARLGLPPTVPDGATRILVLDIPACGRPAPRPGASVADTVSSRSCEFCRG